MKWIGMTLILVCAYQAGKGLYEGLAERERLFSDICRFILSASNDIKQRIPLDSIVEQASDRDNSPEFLQVCAQRIRDGDGFHESWLYAVNESPDMLRLRSDEQTELERFGGDLGCYDLCGELSVLEQAMGYFSERRTAAQRELREKSRIYMTCSMLAGAAVILLLF